MITTAFINFAQYILAFFVQLFPLSAGFPTEVNAAFAYFGGYVGMLDPILPIDTLASVLAILITVELGIFAFKTLSWVFSKIPILGK